MLPGSTLRMPTRPVIGALMWQYATLSLRLLDLRVVRLDRPFVDAHLRLLGVVLLLRNDAGFVEIGVALQVVPRVLAASPHP